MNFIVTAATQQSIVMPGPMYWSDSVIKYESKCINSERCVAYIWFYIYLRRQHVSIAEGSGKNSNSDAISNHGDFIVQPYPLLVDLHSSSLLFFHASKCKLEFRQQPFKWKGIECRHWACKIIIFLFSRDEIILNSILSLVSTGYDNI